MMTIQQALETIHQQIQTSTQLAHRPESAVTLLAVSKTKPNEAILEAYQAGQKAFGENYVQEGVDKIQYFEAQNIQLEWHFIGPLARGRIGVRVGAGFHTRLVTLESTFGRVGVLIAYMHLPACVHHQIGRASCRERV